jgi:hypothetical protein
MIFSSAMTGLPICPGRVLIAYPILNILRSMETIQFFFENPYCFKFILSPVLLKG